MQTLSVEPELPSLTSGPVHYVACHQDAVHIESQQGEKASTELQVSPAALQAGSVPSPVAFDSGVIDPFNALPIGGSPRYTNYILSPCKFSHT